MPKNLPELNKLLQSGALSYGKWGRMFESRIGEYIGNNNVLTVNSYNSALLVTIASLGLTANDEVIASPMSCLASNQPFMTQNVKIKWADIDPSTGTLCPDSVKSKITENTKVILHNHFCGYPGYINEINDLGKEKGIFVIDDGIEAFGSEYQGNKIGNVNTDVTVFSFQTVRLPNTIDGGAIIFKDSELYNKALLIRDYGIDRRTFRDSLGEIDPQCNISLPGFGATISEPNSYIGYIQMDHIKKLFSIQRKNAQRWTDSMHTWNLQCKVLGKNKDTLPNYWIFGIQVQDKLASLRYFREEGYYASSIHLNNNAYSVFGQFENLPGVNDFFAHFLALPCGWWFKTSKLSAGL